ncbi:MAG: phosphatidylglycerophosphatase A [Endomicrobiia bacterium]|jgi:phosphatidylglycerophosphatase A|nr:phosphatidylglycerophosphatase A [Endomicrobiaceae bacterium]MDD3922460.1 phosphatidylglycerophosphatase A [Endomicrobiaceae bacterium]MDD5101358.1 phosphatidylglycerophosphatase A [Endomicrobiaceae bacterium]
MIKHIIYFLKNKKKVSFLLGTLCYVGYFPVAPGTIGSLVSLPIIFGVCYYFGTFGLIILIFLSFILAMVSTKEILLYTTHDPSFIVIDEFVGQSVTFLFVSNLLKNNMNVWWLYIVGFFLFRLFDVRKPFPVNYADKKMNNAFGVVLDDVFAGLYAAIGTYIVVLFL